MYTSSLASRSGVGPQIPTDGLIGLFDFGNPKSYPGTGTTVYNLAPSGSFNATLYNSPTFVQQKERSYMQFTQASSTYMSYTMPQKGTSSTIITVMSLGPTWGAYTTVAGFITKINETPNYRMGMRTQLDETYSPPFEPTIDVFDATGNFNYNVLSIPTASPVRMYYCGNNDNVALISGYNNYYDNVYGTAGTVSLLPDTNLSMFLGGIPSTAVPPGDFVDAKIYYHMLYTRLLTQAEILNVYNGLKTRYGLVDIY